MLDIGSIELRVKVTRKHSIDFLVCQFARTLDDALANPGFFIRDSASVWVNFENDADCESVLARKQ